MIEEVSNYLNQIRSDFSQQRFDESDALDSPFEQYAKWFEEAVGAQVLDPKAVTISTVDVDGKPSSRVVYFRGMDESGFLFYTNYLSKKGHDLSSNNHMAVNIFWPELERQIRMEGLVEKATEKESDAYFAARPRESQIGAWASEQSQQIDSREALEQRVIELTKEFEGKEVTRPPHWGGYRFRPNYFEFWQGRPSRLHDRICYRQEENSWKMFRVNP